MAIVASAQVLLAGTLLLAVPSVVRVAEPAPVSGMEEVAETTVVPVVAEVMTTVQLAVVGRASCRHGGESTKLPGPLVILAVAEPLPKVAATAVTEMVSVCLVPTALVAVAGVMAMVASGHVLLAVPPLPAVPSVVRVTEPSPVSGMEEVAETTVVPVVAEVMTTVQLA